MQICTGHEGSRHGVPFMRPNGTRRRHALRAGRHGRQQAQDAASVGTAAVGARKQRQAAGLKRSAAGARKAARLKE